MARIRSVHPSLFTDEAWVSCSPLARLLYIGLMTDADDQGLFEWKPLQIRMRLLPGDNAEVAELLAELVAANLISGLESGGKKLGAIRYFRRFQRPKKPNSVFVLPAEWRTYVGLSDDGSELDDDDELEVPKKGEKSPQMEDGGGRREDGDNPPDPPAGGNPADRRKPKRSIPDGFPTAELIAEQQAKARDAGANVDAAYQAERFRNWSAGKDAKYADWPATWRNWMLRTIREAPKAATGAASAPEDPDAVWRRRVQAFASNQYWNRLDWGPAPGKEGCRVSPEIQREHGIEPAAPRAVGAA